MVKAATKIPLHHQLPLPILLKRQPLNCSNPLPQPNPNNQHQINYPWKKKETSWTNRRTSREENMHINKPNTYRTPKTNTTPTISRLPHNLRPKTRNPSSNHHVARRPSQRVPHRALRCLCPPRRWREIWRTQRTTTHHHQRRPRGSSKYNIYNSLFTIIPSSIWV